MPAPPIVNGCKKPEGETADENVPQHVQMIDATCLPMTLDDSKPVPIIQGPERQASDEMTAFDGSLQGMSAVVSSEETDGQQVVFQTSLPYL